jgi:hypothetical protein
MNACSLVGRYLHFHRQENPKTNLFSILYSQLYPNAQKAGNIYFPLASMKNMLYL